MAGGPGKSSTEEGVWEISSVSGWAQEDKTNVNKTKSTIIFLGFFILGFIM